MSSRFPPYFSRLFPDVLANLCPYEVGFYSTLDLSHLWTSLANERGGRWPACFGELASTEVFVAPSVNSVESM